MILDKLHLENPESLTSVILGKADKMAKDQHDEIVNRLVDSVYPDLITFMTKQELPKKAHECKTMDELEKLEYQLFDPALFKIIAEKLDSEEELTDFGRIFIYTHIIERIGFGSKQYVTKLLQDRARVLLMQKPKIIH